MSESQFNYVFT